MAKVSESTGMLSVDHVDLLITAATRWDVLVSPSRHALAATSLQLVAGEPDALGRQLLVANVESLRRQPAKPALDRLAATLRVPAYRFIPVETPLVPLEVIKAAQAAEHLCGAAPHWHGSAPARLLIGVKEAATHRLDGYSAAPYLWQRPARRSGLPIGYGAEWRPDVDGLEWVERPHLVQRWTNARMIVLTADVVDDLPPALPARSGIVVLQSEQTPGVSWASLNSSPAGHVVFWPTAEAWLLEQLQLPVPDFAGYRAG